MHQIAEEKVAQFAQMLLKEERSPGTIENYLRHIRAFAQWLNGQEVTLEAVTTWKGNLLDKEYSPGSINAMLLALNRFFKFMGWNDCKVKSLRIQRQMFRETTKELTRKEYVQLLSAAQAQGKNRLVLLMEAICCTGIRVSEVQYLTVESVREGKAVISLKGKIRTILIPSKLRKKLLQFAKNHLRRDLPHQKWHTDFPKTNLGRDESPLQKSRSRSFQSVSSQPETPFRTNIL